MKETETERLLVKEFNLEDFGPLERVVYSDSDVRRYCGEVRGFEELGGRLAYAVDSPVGEKIREGRVRGEGFGSWTVHRREDGQLLGYVTLGPVDRAYWIVFENDPDEALVSFEVELCAALGSQFRGAGYATEACRVVVDYAFQKLRLHRLTTHVDADNAAGITLARSLGFRIESNKHPEFGGLVAVLDNNVS